MGRQKKHRNFGQCKVCKTNLVSLHYWGSGSGQGVVENYAYCKDCKIVYRFEFEKV